MKNVLYLAGGCFWGVQKYLDSINGIISSFVGYANGDSNATTYKQVCNGSGHVEVVKIVYNDVITIEQLLDKFLKIIDPFSNNKQGNDVGVQYRTGIYYVDDLTGDKCKIWLKKLQSQHAQRIAIECLPLEHFCQAEVEHQKYLEKNPNGYCHISTRLLDI